MRDMFYIRADGNEQSSYERIMNRAESILNDMHGGHDAS